MTARNHMMTEKYLPIESQKHCSMCPHLPLYRVTSGTHENEDVAARATAESRTVQAMRVSGFYAHIPPLIFSQKKIPSMMNAPPKINKKIIQKEARFLWE